MSEKQLPCFIIILCLLLSAQPVSATGSPHYLGDNITFGAQVKDSGGSLIDNASVGIWDPLKQMKVWKSTLAGFVEYLTQASRTGYFPFLFSASKVGYEGASVEKGVLVKGFGEIVVNAQTKDGQPIAGATVKIDGASIGSTNAQGKFAIEMGQGTHTVEVCENGYCMSKSTQITHNGDVDELSFRFEGAGLQVNIREPNGYPLANVYVSLDGVHKGVSNPFGIVYMKDVPYGSHVVGFDLNVANETYAGLYHGSKQVTVDEKREVAGAVIALSGSGISVSEIGANAVVVSRSDANMGAELLFIPAVLLLVDIASITWSTNDWCNCAFEAKGDMFGGLQGCIDTIRSCSGDVRNCMQAIYEKTGATAAKCAFEEAMLVGDIASPFIPVGMIGHAAVWVGGNGAAVLGAVGKVVKAADEPQAWKYVKGGLDGFAKWIGDLGRFRHGVDVGLSWTRSWGDEAQDGLRRIVERGKFMRNSTTDGMRAGRQFAEILEARHGRGYAEKVAKGLTELEEKGVDIRKVVDKLTINGEYAAGDVSRIVGPAFETEVATLPQRINNVKSLGELTSTSLSKGATDMDILLKNGEIIEAKDWWWNAINKSDIDDLTAELGQKIRDFKNYQREILKTPDAKIIVALKNNPDDLKGWIPYLREWLEKRGVVVEVIP